KAAPRREVLRTGRKDGAFIEDRPGQARPVPREVPFGRPEGPARTPEEVLPRNLMPPRGSGTLRDLMHFRTFDELTPSMEMDRTLIHLASFGGAFPRRSVDVWRRRTRLVADYVGVFAVERGRLLGQT